MEKFMDELSGVLTVVDDFVWGPVMLILLVGTGIWLTVRLRFRTWRNLGYAIASTFSRESRNAVRGEGDIPPFSALKYCRRCDSNGIWRSGSIGLDVDFRSIWTFIQVQ